MDNTNTSLSHPNVKDITGMKFGRLTAVRRIGTKGTYALWLCQCECGNTTETTSGNLRSGQSQSCGCLRVERVKAATTSHGLSKTMDYESWKSMVSRCTNPNDPSFHYYGGRGIMVCERWLHSFENFIADVGRRPSGAHTIDRVNNAGDYEPGNCVWATKKEQANNRRNTRWIFFEGKKLTVSQWSELKRISYHTLKTRLRRGWTLERALNTPPEAELTAAPQ